MPPHSYMKDEQLADILTYVRNAKGNRENLSSKSDFSIQGSSQSAPWTEEEITVLD